jgi:hypothetical protein
LQSSLSFFDAKGREREKTAPTPGVTWRFSDTLDLKGSAQVHVWLAGEGFGIPAVVRRGMREFTILIYPMYDAIETATTEQSRCILSGRSPF